MRFTKISITKRRVDLTHERKGANGALEETHLSSPERPLPAFADALQGFRPYVMDLLGLPDHWEDGLTITTLNLSEDKNGLRGLIVTAIKPVAKAYDKPLVLNTPLVREAGENASEEAFTLSNDVMALIGLVESEAMRYANGEREQAELFDRATTQAAPKSAAAESFNERSAAAEVASTRKPRLRKPKTFVPGAGEVANPNATEPVTDDKLVELLAAVGKHVPVDAVAHLTSTERDQAQRWAELAAKGQPSSVPLCVQRFATSPLVH